MYKLSSLFFLHVQTPLHAGSGQDLGMVDQPIQRERHSGFPKVEGSGIKGSLRQIFSDNYGDKEEALKIAFGPEPEEESEHAGSLGFTDARLLLFPIKSMRGVFALATCPAVLERLRSDLSLVKSKNGEKADLELPDSFKENSVSSDLLIIKDNKVGLEEYTFEVNKDEGTKKLAKILSEKTGISHIKKRLIVLSDNDFSDFVEMSTEVITRTRINSETGTVEDGGLFTEEYLPSESLLYSLALASPIFVNNDSREQKQKALQEVVKLLIENKKGFNLSVEKAADEELAQAFFQAGLPEVIQIGGNMTTGKGLLRTKIL